MKKTPVGTLRGIAGALRRAAGTPASPWQPQPPYLALRDVDPRPLAGQAGVVAVWHLGVRPRWLRIAGGTDLAVLVGALQAQAALRTARAHGGVYLAWAVLEPAVIAAATASLVAQLRPALQTPVLAGELVAGALPPTPFPLPPGTRDVARGAG